MLKSPQTMMLAEAPDNRSSLHIREIGPHQHEWVYVGVDGSLERYQECSTCGTRRVVSGNNQDAARQDWLAGGDWDPKPLEGEDGKFKRRPGRPPKIQPDAF